MLPWSVANESSTITSQNGNVIHSNSGDLSMEQIERLDDVALDEDGLALSSTTTNQQHVAKTKKSLVNPLNDERNSSRRASVTSADTAQSTSYNKKMSLYDSFRKSISNIFGKSETSESSVNAYGRSHYRRGTIFLKHLEGKSCSVEDKKLLELIKSQFNSHKIESRTMISLSVYQTGSNPIDDPFSVINMPTELQRGFRRKLFALFSIQLFLVVVMISALRFIPISREFLSNNFKSSSSVVGLFIVMTLALFALYSTKYKYPLNFFVLGIFTIAQSIFLSAMDIYFQSQVSLFIFSFLFVTMIFTTIFSTRVAKRSFDPKFPSILISYSTAILVAFFCAFLCSLVVYFTWLDGHGHNPPLLPDIEYSGSLAAVLLLVIWFSYDASCMNERLSPDEYMQGMVYFYTDMILFILFLAFIVAACSCEGDCLCYGNADIIPIGRGIGNENKNEGEADQSIDQVQTIEGREVRENDNLT